MKICEVSKLRARKNFGEIDVDLDTTEPLDSHESIRNNTKVIEISTDPSRSFPKILKLYIRVPIGKIRAKSIEISNEKKNMEIFRDLHRSCSNFFYLSLKFRFLNLGIYYLIRNIDVIRYHFSTRPLNKNSKNNPGIVREKIRFRPS